MFVCKIYVASNNEMYIGLHVKCLMLHQKKFMLVFSLPYSDVQFGYTDRNDRYVAAQFLTFLSVSVKHCKVSDGISQLRR